MGSIKPVHAPCGEDMAIVCRSRGRVMNSSVQQQEGSGAQPGRGPRHGVLPGLHGHRACCGAAVRGSWSGHRRGPELQALASRSCSVSCPPGTCRSVRRRRALRPGPCSWASDTACSCMRTTSRPWRRLRLSRRVADFRCRRRDALRQAALGHGEVSGSAASVACSSPVSCRRRVRLAAAGLLLFAGFDELVFVQMLIGWLPLAFALTIVDPPVERAECIASRERERGLRLLFASDEFSGEPSS